MSRTTELRAFGVTLVTAFLAACGSDSAGGPSPLVGGISVTAPELTLVADTGLLAAAALDANGDTIPGATIAWINTTPDIALLLPNGRFVGRKPGVLILRALSGQVEEAESTAVVDTACGRIAAVPGWTVSAGVAYARTLHHQVQYSSDSFDVHVDERATATGAQLSGPHVLNGDPGAIYWSGLPASASAAFQDVDTVHRAGGDSVFTATASAAAPVDYTSVDLIVYLFACQFAGDVTIRGAAATAGPGVAADSAFVGPYFTFGGPVTGPGPISSGPDSVVLAIAHHDGFAGLDSAGGELYLQGLPLAVTQASLGSTWPFSSTLTDWDPGVASLLGTARAVWSYSPTLLDAPHPSRAVPPAGAEGRWPMRR